MDATLIWVKMRVQWDYTSPSGDSDSGHIAHEFIRLKWTNHLITILQRVFPHPMHLAVPLSATTKHNAISAPEKKTPAPQINTPRVLCLLNNLSDIT